MQRVGIVVLEVLVGELELAAVWGFVAALELLAPGNAEVEQREVGEHDAAARQERGRPLFFGWGGVVLLQRRWTASVRAVWSRGRAGCATAVAFGAGDREGEAVVGMVALSAHPLAAWHSLEE